jgi:hypothetical protein
MPGAIRPSWRSTSDPEGAMAGKKSREEPAAHAGARSAAAVRRTRDPPVILGAPVTFDFFRWSLDRLAGLRERTLA